MTRIVAGFLCSILIVGAAPAFACSTETKFDNFSTAVADSPLRDEALSSFVTKYHRDHFDQEVAWDQLSARELKAEFKAADLAVFHTMSPVFVDRMSQALGRLETHGLATPAHYKVLYGDWLLSGMYEQARGLQVRLPSLRLPPVPEVVGEGRISDGAEAFLLARSENLLELVERPAVEGTEIVVISHPLCNFSARAFQVITGNPELRELFSRRATWVSPPQRKLYTEQMLHWGEQDPTQRILQAYRPSAGSIFRTRTTPTFFFVENGKVIDTLVGWPGDGQLEALKRKLSALGLLP